MNYFNLFKLPQKIELNINDLEYQYYKLQKQFHPDTYNQENLKTNENELSLQKSISINQGYRTLKNILTRAEHLLFLNKTELNLQKKIIFDQNFLTMQLKLFEQLELRKKMKKYDMQDILIQVNNQKINYINELKVFCNTQQWKLVRITLCKLLFFNKFNEKIKNYTFK